MKFIFWSKFVLVFLALFMTGAVAHQALALDASSFPCPQGLNCSSQITVGSAPVFVNGFISQIIQWLLSFALGLAVLFVVIGGFRYMISGGNEEAADTAKNTVVNALIGIVLIILSYSIVQVVVNLISQRGGGGGV